MSALVAKSYDVSKLCCTCSKITDFPASNAHLALITNSSIHGQMIETKAGAILETTLWVLASF